MSTYNDKQNEVDEVVEGVGIHDVVHDLHPTFQGDHLQGRVGHGYQASSALRLNYTRKFIHLFITLILRAANCPKTRSYQLTAAGNRRNVRLASGSGGRPT